MTFSDIFKSSFLKNVTSVSVLDMVLALGLAFAIGLFIFLIYRKTYAGVMYSSSFGVTLVGLTMISTFVILAVTSNVVLSPGHYLPLLGHRRGHRSGRRHDPPGGAGQRVHRPGAAGVRQ